MTGHFRSDTSARAAFRVAHEPRPVSGTGSGRDVCLVSPDTQVRNLSPFTVQGGLPTGCWRDGAPEQLRSIRRNHPRQVEIPLRRSDQCVILDAADLPHVNRATGVVHPHEIVDEGLVINEVVPDPDLRPVEPGLPEPARRVVPGHRCRSGPGLQTRCAKPRWHHLGMTGDGALSQWARAAMSHIAERADGPAVDRSSRVTLNFHPDRQSGGVTVMEHLATDRVYRSQHETGTSNGGLTAHPGGDRWLWEQRMFAHAYDDAPADQRPKYGALNHRSRGMGGAPRFGSAHLRLDEQVLDRTTFCFPDSVFDPSDFGTAAHMDLIRLAQDVDERTLSDEIEAAEGGVLDDYVEAHVHGLIRLECDVEALVLDPSFRGTPIEDQAARLGVPVDWHAGRQLLVEQLTQHPVFRGPHIVEVGRRIAVDGVLNARIVGVAHDHRREDPQDLKKVWHYVARFGTPLHDVG